MTSLPPERNASAITATFFDILSIHYLFLRTLRIEVVQSEIGLAKRRVKTELKSRTTLNEKPAVAKFSVLVDAKKKPRSQKQNRQRDC